MRCVTVANSGRGNSILAQHESSTLVQAFSHENATVVILEAGRAVIGLADSSVLDAPRLDSPFLQANCLVLPREAANGTFFTS